MGRAAAADGTRVPAESEQAGDEVSLQHDGKAFAYEVGM